MNRKFFLSLLVSIATSLILSSCAQDNRQDNKQKALPLTQSPAEPVKITPKPPEPAPPNQPNPQPVPPENVKLPIVSFVQARIITNTRNEAQLEIQLSEMTAVPVIVEVYLANGSALYHRDFSGFKLRYASVKAETRQTLIFAPKMTRLLLPIIGVRNTINCDTEFYVKISKNLKNAKLENDTAKVLIPCI